MGPELLTFFSNVIFEADAEQDAETARNYAQTLSPEKRERLATQLRAYQNTDIATEELGSQANRWFSTAEEAQEWLSQLLPAFAEASGATTVKDSNGTVLAEGDSVTVIKDLKVKGGSSDLKRGTMIRKIHLVDDPEVVECRVDGSTLVLKTCFLKKA